MSKQTKVMTKVSTVIGFIKDQIKNDISNAVNSGLIKIDKNEVERTCNVIIASIETSYARSMGEVLSVLEEK